MLSNAIAVAVASIVVVVVGSVQLHHFRTQRDQRIRILELEDLISWYVTADLG